MPLCCCGCRCPLAALPLRRGEARRLRRGLLSKKTREDGKARKTSARARGTCATSERRREQRLEPLSSERSLNSKALAFAEQTLGVTLTQAPTALVSRLFSLLIPLSSLVFSIISSLLSRHVVARRRLFSLSLVTKTKSESSLRHPSRRSLSFRLALVASSQTSCGRSCVRVASKSIISSRGTIRTEAGKAHRCGPHRRRHKPP